jgi:hypothetical protein
MHNLETESLWSQVSGQCIRGEQEGKLLELYPSSISTFAEYRKSYPDGLILVKPEKGEAGSSYDSYFANDTKLGMFGRVDNFQRLAGKDLVYGLRTGDRQVAVAEKYLEKHGYAYVDQLQPPVLITFNKEGNSVSAFAVNGAEPAADAFAVRNNKITRGDGKEKIAWDATTGRLLEGKGQDLKEVAVMSAYWFAWAGFFPETDLVR